jgi:hypothetical protein
MNSHQRSTIATDFDTEKERLCAGLLELWGLVVCTLAVPAIKNGLFDAMSTDDAIGGSAGSDRRPGLVRPDPAPAGSAGCFDPLVTGDRCAAGCF